MVAMRLCVFLSRFIDLIVAGARLQCIYRWVHPAQQHGLRMPELSFDLPTTIRLALVSCFLAEVIQQIHSFRASGVMSSQISDSFKSLSNAFFRSCGIL